MAKKSVMPVVVIVKGWVAICPRCRRDVAVGVAHRASELVGKVRSCRCGQRFRLE